MSIIVPVYNVEKYITDCFQSIINQTYSGPMECLFIDDCGGDGSIDILERLVEAYDGPIRFNIIRHQKNSGPSVARNSGIKNSKGDYIFFMDSDDQLYPQTIENLLDAAVRESQPDIVLGSYQVNIPESFINQYHYKYKVYNGQPVIAKAFLDDTFFCMSHNKLVRRDFIVNNNLFFKEGLHQAEDNLWSFQSFHLAQNVVTIPDKTYYHLIHSGSIMTTSSSERQLRNVMILRNKVLNDARNGRYDFVEKESLNYVERLIKIKSGGLLNQIYVSGLSHKERVSRLKSIPDDLMELMQQYSFSDTLFMKSLKCLLKLGLYNLFDAVMSKLYSDRKRD